MNPEQRIKQGCPKCGSYQLQVTQTSLLSKVSAGGCRTESCSTGEINEELKCLICGYVEHEHSYDKEKDGRREAAKRAIENGGHRSFLRFD